MPRERPPPPFGASSIGADGADRTPRPGLLTPTVRAAGWRGCQPSYHAPRGAVLVEVWGRHSPVAASGARSTAGGNHPVPSMASDDRRRPLQTCRGVAQAWKEYETIIMTGTTRSLHARTHGPWGPSSPRAPAHLATSPCSTRGHQTNSQKKTIIVRATVSVPRITARPSF